MRVILLAILFFNSAKAQDYVANWVTVPKEVGVVNYQVQVLSGLSGNTWTTIATIAPKKNADDSNFYAYILPSEDNYVRIKALMVNNIFYTVPIKVVNKNVAITNPLVKVNINFDNISFTASNESEVDYYSIEKNNTGSDNKWTVAGKLTQTNKNNYVVNIYNPGERYRLISVYVNGLKSDYIYFQE